jgi:HK97 gp10 family phage protein
MPQQTTVTVSYREAGERELMTSGYVREVMQGIGDRIAADASEHAPHRSGAGARSIHAVTELGPNGWEVRIGWSRPSYYLGFHETGTVYMPARPFLVPALDRARGI